MAKQKKLTGVNETLTAMIANWPSLYPSRLTALRRVFTNHMNWSDGTPQSNDSIFTRDDSMDTPLDETLKGSDTYSPNVQILRLRKERQTYEFTRTNAALIAAAEYGDFYDFEHTPSFSTYDLNSIPLEKLTPEWRAALIEFCNAIIAVTEDSVRTDPSVRHYSKDAIEKKVVQLQDAKATARECLMRLGEGKKEEEAARNRALDELRAQAHRLGFKLERVNPENPFA